jgi:Zn-dependent oligopeptidase
MQLSNRFNDEEKNRVWCFQHTCANPDCNSNEILSVHHIYGAKGPFNDSICNSIMLCIDCHRIADGQNTFQTGNPLRKKYLKVALKQVIKSGHQFHDNDKNFLSSIQADVTSVLHEK